MSRDGRPGSSSWLTAAAGMFLLAFVGYWFGGPHPGDAQPQPQPEPVEVSTVVRGYRVPQEHLQAAVDELREVFPADTGARFAIDSRMRQILAVAPAEL